MHNGEAEAIALAFERHTAVIFPDGLEARRAAEVYGLRKTGVIASMYFHDSKEGTPEEDMVGVKDEVDGTAGLKDLFTRAYLPRA